MRLPSLTKWVEKQISIHMQTSRHTKITPHSSCLVLYHFLSNWLKAFTYVHLPPPLPPQWIIDLFSFLLVAAYFLPNQQTPNYLVYNSRCFNYSPFIFQLYHFFHCLPLSNSLATCYWSWMSSIFFFFSSICNLLFSTVLEFRPCSIGSYLTLAKHLEIRVL